MLPLLLVPYISSDPQIASVLGLVFLGPALGASLMTFFGYAVSDLTQSWLLYQGTLFVLVMRSWSWPISVASVGW